MWTKLSVLSKSLTKVPKCFFSPSDPMISAKDAYSLLQTDKNTFFLDIRDPSNFKKAHIPSAQNINEVFSYLGTSDPAGIKSMVSTFEKLFQQAGITGKEHIITYEECLKTRFGASCRGYFLLKLLGHSRVNVLDGGYEAWLNAKFPVTQEYQPIATQGTFKAKWQEGIYASKDDVLKALNEPSSNKPILLDVRDIDEWNAESSSPYGKDFVPRKGHIPGAIHIVWKDFMKTVDGATFLKEPQEVREICKQKGIRDDREILVYCFKGARASNSLIALERAGFKNVKNYFASWNEWARDQSLPIE